MKKNLLLSVLFLLASTAGMTGQGVKTLKWTGNQDNNWDLTSANWEESGNEGTDIPWEEGSIAMFETDMGGNPITVGTNITVKEIHAKKDVILQGSSGSLTATDDELLVYTYHSGTTLTLEVSIGGERKIIKKEETLSGGYDDSEKNNNLHIKSPASLAYLSIESGVVGYFSQSLPEVEVSDGCSMEYNLDGEYSYNGSITGDGIFSIKGNGKLDFLEGTLGTKSISVGSSCNLTCKPSSLQGNLAIENGGIVTFENVENDVTFDNVINNEGLLVNVDAITLTLGGENTGDGRIKMEQGNLVGNTKSLIWDVSFEVSGSFIQFEMDELGTYAKEIKGEPTLIKTGTEDLTLSGLYLFSNIQVKEGNLIIDDLVSNAEIMQGTTLQTNLTQKVQSGTILSGNGTFVKTGNSELIFSGKHTFTGKTIISEGPFVIESGGSYAGEVTVETDGEVIFKDGAGLDENIAIVVEGSGKFEDQTGTVQNVSVEGGDPVEIVGLEQDGGSLSGGKRNIEITLDYDETKHTPVLTIQKLDGDKWEDLEEEPEMPLKRAQDKKTILLPSTEEGEYRVKVEFTNITLYSPSITVTEGPPVEPVSYTVTLELGGGIHSNYQAGGLVVNEGDFLQFIFSAEDTGLEAGDILFTIDGKETAFKDNGSAGFSYILSQIEAAHTVVIAQKEYTVTLPEVDGATLEPGPGTHTVAYGGLFSFILDALNEDQAPGDIHVYVNGTELTPDDMGTKAFQPLLYTIPKVTEAIEITIEGVEPVSNTDIAAGNIGIAVESGMLKVENEKGATRLTVYTLTGYLYTSRSLPVGTTTVELPQGIYIVRAGTEIFKVVVN